MKINRLISGIALVFIGVVILLDNLGVITFYWQNVWSFWPIALIVAGLCILFNRNNSQAGNIICLVVFITALGFLFYKGQQEPKQTNWVKQYKDEILLDDDQDDDTLKKVDLIQPFTLLDSTKKVVLNISGGGLSFNLKGSTNDLINAKINQKKTKFVLDKEITDSATVLTLRMPKTNKRWRFDMDGNDVDLKLNKTANWDINLKLGAGAVDFDLSDYKVRNLTFNGGAAQLELKFGNLLPITDVAIKSGVANVELKIPTESGCRIKSKTGLSSKDFKGFEKVSEGVFETSNYKTSTKKIFINFDGGLSNFEVSRY